MRDRTPAFIICPHNGDSTHALHLGGSPLATTMKARDKFSGLQIRDTQDTESFTNMRRKINHSIMHKYSTEIGPIMNSLKIKEDQRISMSKMRNDFDNIAFKVTLE